MYTHNALGHWALRSLLHCMLAGLLWGCWLRRCEDDQSKSMEVVETRLRLGRRLGCLADHLLNAESVNLSQRNKYQAHGYFENAPF